MIEAILNRLDKVRQTGPDRWVARCPAHDDRSPSLSLRDTGERTLIRCHAGCAAADVVAAVGLELKDLFPESNLTPKQRQAYRQQQSSADIEAGLSHELTVLGLIIGNRVADRQLSKDSRFKAQRPEWRPLPNEHWDRERLAARRIQSALGVLYAR